MIPSNMDFGQIAEIMEAINSNVDLSKLQNVKYDNLVIKYKVTQDVNKTNVALKVEISPPDAEIESRIKEILNVINVLLTTSKNPPTVKFYKVTD